MSQLIGHEPALQRLTLVDGQDLAHVFVPLGEALPSGTVVELRIYSRDHSELYGVWPVTLTGDGWLVNVEAADHERVPTGSRFRLFTTYPAGGGRFCWIAGPVVRSRR